MTLRLGLDSFSVRSQGWPAHEILSFAANLGFDAVQFSEAPREFESFEPAYVRSLGEHARKLGLDIEVGMRSFCRLAESFEPQRGTGEQQLIQMIGAAVALGSPIVRCFLGRWHDHHTGQPFDRKFEEAIRTLRAVRQHALDAGVMIGVENHAGDMQSSTLVELIRAAGTEHVGACIDTGNALWAMEDPHVVVERLAPYAVTTQIRDGVVWLEKDYVVTDWTPMGQGILDIPRIVGTIERLARRDVLLNLEVICDIGQRRFPIYDRDFWVRYPRATAPDTAAFMRLAVRGMPRDNPRISLLVGQDADPATMEIYKRQQREDVETSVRYCRERLGLGRR